MVKRSLAARPISIPFLFVIMSAVNIDFPNLFFRYLPELRNLFTMSSLLVKFIVEGSDTVLRCPIPDSLISKSHPQARRPRPVQPSLMGVSSSNWAS